MARDDEIIEDCETTPTNTSDLNSVSIYSSSIKSDARAWRVKPPHTKKSHFQLIMLINLHIQKLTIIKILFFKYNCCRMIIFMDKIS